MDIMILDWVDGRIDSGRALQVLMNKVLKVLKVVRRYEFDDDWSSTRIGRRPEFDDDRDWVSQC